MKFSIFHQYGNYINGLKRAAGFVGMRGKKDNSDDSLGADDLNLNEDLVQFIFGPRPARAGFVGMRGKKVTCRNCNKNSIVTDSLDR